MTAHARDLRIEFDAADEDVAVVIAGLVEWVERRLSEEAALRRIDNYRVSVARVEAVSA